MTKVIIDADDPVGYLTAYDMHMLIEVLNGIEESYNLDIEEGIDRSADIERGLIPWAKHTIKVLSKALESADKYDLSN